MAQGAGAGIRLYMPFSLGIKIARHRRKTGLTQNALGARLGVSAQAVSKWERQLAYPDITLLPAIADLFGTLLGNGRSLPQCKINDRGRGFCHLFFVNIHD